MFSLYSNRIWLLRKSNQSNWLLLTNCLVLILSINLSTQSVNGGLFSSISGKPSSSPSSSGSWRHGISSSIGKLLKTKKSQTYSDEFDDPQYESKSSRWKLSPSSVAGKANKVFNRKSNRKQNDQSQRYPSWPTNDEPEETIHQHQAQVQQKTMQPRQQTDEGFYPNYTDQRPQTRQPVNHEPQNRPLPQEDFRPRSHGPQNQRYEQAPSDHQQRNYGPGAMRPQPEEYKVPIQYPPNNNIPFTKDPTRDHNLDARQPEVMKNNLAEQTDGPKWNHVDKQPPRFNSIMPAEHAFRTTKMMEFARPFLDSHVQKMLDEVSQKQARLSDASKQPNLTQSIDGTENEPNKKIQSPTDGSNKNLDPANEISTIGDKSDTINGKPSIDNSEMKSSKETEEVKEDIKNDQSIKESKNGVSESESKLSPEERRDIDGGKKTKKIDELVNKEQPEVVKSKQQSELERDNNRYPLSDKHNREDLIEKKSVDTKENRDEIVETKSSEFDLDNDWYRYFQSDDDHYADHSGERGHDTNDVNSEHHEVDSESDKPYEFIEPIRGDQSTDQDHRSSVKRERDQPTTPKDDYPVLDDNSIWEYLSNDNDKDSQNKADDLISNQRMSFDHIDRAAKLLEYSDLDDDPRDDSKEIELKSGAAMNEDDEKSVKIKPVIEDTEQHHMSDSISSRPLSVPVDDNTATAEKRMEMDIGHQVEESKRKEEVNGIIEKDESKKLNAKSGQKIDLEDSVTKDDEVSDSIKSSGQIESDSEQELTSKKAKKGDTNFKRNRRNRKQKKKRKNNYDYDYTL